MTVLIILTQSGVMTMHGIPRGPENINSALLQRIQVALQSRNGFRVCSSDTKLNKFRTKQLEPRQK